MPRPLLALACLLLLTGAAPRPDRPLGVVTPGSLRLLFLDLPLGDARPGPAAFEARWEVANDWSTPTLLTRNGRYVLVQLDEQADVLTLVLRLPWARVAGQGPLLDRLETTAEWRLIHHWGGYTDGLIEGWHAFGGYNTFQRPGHPADAVALHLLEPGGAKVGSLTAPATAAGDLALRTSLRWAEGELAGRPWAAVLRVDLKVPVGRPEVFGGSGRPDAGLGLGGSLPVTGWLTVHGLVSARAVSDLPGGLPLRVRPLQYGAELSLVAWYRAFAFLAEARAQTALFEPGWTLYGKPGQGDALTAVTRSQNQLGFGLRWGGLTAWFLEDWTLGAREAVGWTGAYNSNAPDLALGLSWIAPL